MQTPPENRIREMRQRAGQTQEELAHALGTSSGQVHKLESGKLGLSLQWMVRIADALGCHARDLIPPPSGSVEERAGQLTEKAQILTKLVAAGHFRAASALASDLGKALGAAADDFPD